MKTLSILGLLSSTAFSQQYGNDWNSLDAGLSRGEIGHQVVPNGIAPKIQQLRPRLTKYHPAAMRTKVRYGPYTMPSSKAVTFSESGESGMISKLAVLERPCPGECNILMAQSDLEYANGTQATNKDGAWLHHITIYAHGPGRRDTVCPASLYSLLGERFYSSGNERSTVAYGDVLMKGKNKVKSAFQLNSGDTFYTQLALRNLDTEEKQVYITVDYEWFAPSAEDKKEWKSAKALWLSISGCFTTYVKPPQGQARFTIPSTAWNSPFSGDLLNAGGHLHDGGTIIRVHQKFTNTTRRDDKLKSDPRFKLDTNGDVTLCESRATYGVGGHMHKKRSTATDVDGKKHISTMSVCWDLGRISSDDGIYITASYDFTAHDPMKSESGGLASVMGIAMIFAAADVNA